MYTGQRGASPVPGKLMPMLAAFDSPGPFTMQPITARVIDSTPSYCVFQMGMLSRIYAWIRSANSWNVVLVVRPQPGHAVTLGENERSPSACSNSQQAYTSSRRSPPGFGVNEIRIVSPIPSASSTPSDADDHTSPFIPIPASVNPRCSGCCVLLDKSRYTVIKSRGREVLHEIIIWSLRNPFSNASSVDCSAESTMQSLIISSLSFPRFLSVFSCILRITSS